MGKPLTLHFDQADRPAYRTDGVAEAYIAVDFVDESILLGEDFYEDAPGGRFYFIPSRHLANEPGKRSPGLDYLPLPSDATMADFVASVQHRLLTEAYQPATIPKFTLDLGPNPGPRKPKRPHLSPAIAKAGFEKNNGTGWPVMVRQLSPELPTDLYLDGLNVSNLLLDFRDATLKLRLQKFVPSTWGPNDDQTIAGEYEPEILDKTWLHYFLAQSITQGQTFEDQLKTALVSVLSEYYGQPLKRGWVAKTIVHGERLSRAESDDPDRPAITVGVYTYRNGHPVRLRDTGKSWNIPAIEVVGTPAERAADRERIAKEKGKK